MPVTRNESKVWHVREKVTLMLQYGACLRADERAALRARREAAGEADADGSSDLPNHAVRQVAAALLLQAACRRLSARRRCTTMRAEADAAATAREVESAAVAVVESLDETVAMWLDAIGLARYKPVFAAAGVDAGRLAFLIMSDEGLKRIGVEALGPRRKMTQSSDALFQILARDMF